MIIDVPTEDKALQHLFTIDLRSAMGPTFALPFDRSWIHDIRLLEKRYEEAGLVVEKSWRTKSYILEKWYEGDGGIPNKIRALIYIQLVGAKDLLCVELSSQYFEHIHALRQLSRPLVRC
jgi:hypothetical protein